ncbi:MAG: glycosyltransferase family 2 protein, partial [Flavobacteriaceae bacterium]|nr:glycosyltransferase family 2 protein [Flavobacteriaceae bacterium]
GQYDTNKDIFWASGACFFVRSHIFHQLNGFDEGYFAHQEEIDFCWRIQHTGHRIRYVADSIVYHVGGATLSNSSPKKSYLNFRNSLFTLVKNVPQKKLFGSIFLRMCLDLIAVIKFIFELKPWHAWAVLKAHISFYKHLSYYLSKRKEHINKKEDYFHSMSIVWKYFIARKTRFDQLD